MKNGVYLLFLLAACNRPQLPPNDILSHDEHFITPPALKDTIINEEHSTEFPELPVYPFNYVGPDACLPNPTPEFLQGRKAGTLLNFTDSDGLFLDEIYLYLEMALDTVSTKQFYGSPYSSINLIWGQEFENGIYYVYQELESGGSVELWSHCRDKDAFFRAINLVISEDEEGESYGWNNLQTEYGPLEGGAGCYYTLDADSLGYCHLSSYCGC